MRQVFMVHRVLEELTVCSIYGASCVLDGTEWQ